MRIVSYNVRYFGHGTRGIASTEGGMRAIAGAVAKLDPLPDVLLLQEVETRSWRSNALHWGKRGEPQIDRFNRMLASDLALKRKTLEHYVAYYFPAHVYGIRQSPLYTTGLAILVRRGLRVAHVDARDITFRDASLVPSLKQTRLCAHVRIVHPKKDDIDLFNTHLSLPSAFAKHFWTEPERMGFGRNQLAEAHEIVEFIKDARKSDRFLLAGDFNASPGSPVYGFLKDKGLGDAFATHRRLSEEELKAFPTAGFMNLRMHLDHMFSGPGLAWRDFADTSPFGERKSLFDGLSDHVPMVGTFEPDTR